MIKKIIFSILLILILSGCVQDDDAVDFPRSLHLQDEMLSWDAVENATSYTISIDGEEYTSTDLFFDLNFLENGSYEIMILTNQDDESSKYSPVFSVVIERDYTAPQNMSLMYDIFLTWDEIENVTSYSIIIDDDEVGSTLVSSYDLSSLILDANQLYQLQVVGNYGAHSTEKSASIAYHSYLGLGIIIQETFTLNQDEPVVLSFMNIIILDYVLVDDLIISEDLYTQTISLIELDASIFESLELGIHEVQLLTPSGYIVVEVNVVNPS